MGRIRIDQCDQFFDITATIGKAGQLILSANFIMADKPLMKCTGGQNPNNGLSQCSILVSLGFIVGIELL